MRDFIMCVLYLAAIGSVGFVIGRVVPKRLFRGDRFPFRSFPWEKEGKVYQALGIRRWKEKVPDMSQIFPSLMPSKRVPDAATPAQVERMVQETCVAEGTHCVLSLLGFGCVFILKGVWGWVVSILYLLGNLPYILIQRFNRPRLMRILQLMQAKRECS